MNKSHFLEKRYGEYFYEINSNRSNECFIYTFLIQEDSSWECKSIKSLPRSWYI